MADDEALIILKNGVSAWNEWVDANPSRADLRRADLTDADLRKAKLSHVKLNRADLRLATLAEADLSAANLNGANLAQAELTCALLDSAKLRGACLAGADLQGAVLTGADFHEADLSAANLSAANLSDANLSGANLIGANLIDANLRGADLDGTNFTEAIVGWTSFTAVDLSRALGLQSVTHQGPSTIGVDTIYDSAGRIPDTFLRGAGIPDKFTAYIGALVSAPVQFYSCFISYSTRDQDFAERLYADLQSKGVRCWFSPHHAVGGKKLHDQIDEAIRLHERLLLILSPASIESEWVKTEIAKARKREVTERRRVLFPVSLMPFDGLRNWECFDGDIGKDSAAEIREYFIPDFSIWKADNDSYTRQLKRLLQDLRVEIKPTSSYR